MKLHNNKLAIITVVYNNYDVLYDFFSSFDSQDDTLFSVFIIDNSNVKKPISHPLYATILPEENKGYAHGVNRGIEEAIQQGFHLFCVINSDIVFSPQFVRATRNSISNHPSSLIGGKIYYQKGYEFHKNRYINEKKGNILWYAGGKLDWKNAYTLHEGVDEVDKGQYDTFKKTDFITGCLMCFDKSVVDGIGLWDESYFMYYEDADYCERAKKNNIALYYDPSLVIWHKNAQSTDGSGSLFHQQYQRKNLLKFGLRYAPLRTKIHLVKNYIFTRFIK